MKIHFCGGAGSVTGVCYLLETKKNKILVDCGLYQGSREMEKTNYEPFKFDPAEIDAVLISHAHLDHIGRLPQLVKDGFEGKIYATPPTVKFSRLILEDSVHILEEKAEHAGAIPLVGNTDVEHVMEHFEPIEYHKKVKISDSVSFTFHNAGHVLGSATSEIEADGKKIVFSGDLGNPPAPLIPAPDFLEEAEYVVIESTYGDSNHEAPEKCEAQIEKVIEASIAKGGTLLIPSFAMERTQQLLFQMNNLVENKRIPSVPIFIDSPLALKITDVYKTYTEYFNEKTQKQIEGGDDIFSFPGLVFTHSSKESKAINEVEPPKIIIAGSGMSQGGRIMHHEALYLEDPKNTLLMVSYQAEHTLGRLIADGRKQLEILDRPVTVNATIEKITGYSAHADQRFLMKWLGKFTKPCYPENTENCGIKKIFVCQGEDKPSNTLASLIRDEIGILAEVPKIGDVAELD